jgi:hypothetical protein
MIALFAVAAVGLVSPTIASARGGGAMEAAVDFTGVAEASMAEGASVAVDFMGAVSAAVVSAAPDLALV